MSLKKLILTLIILAGSMGAKCDPLFAAGKIRIVTTTTTIASLAREVAGDKADIYAIASPNRDIHFISPTPRDVLKVKKADVFIHGGLDLEAWRGPLLDAAGRLDFIHKGERAVDVSEGVPLVEMPASLSRLQGDIHAFGNPHYQVDPLNAKIMTQNIAEGLAALYPEDADLFRKNAQAFDRKVDEKMRSWTREFSNLHGVTVVTYHKNWIYFTDRFGLVIVGEMEPKPGIPPTAKHIGELEKAMKEKDVKIILTEPFREHETSKKIAKETGAKVLNLAQDVGGSKEAGDYIAMIESDLGAVETALASSKRGAQ